MKNQIELQPITSSEEASPFEMSRGRFILYLFLLLPALAIFLMACGGDEVSRHTAPPPRGT